MSDPDGYRNEAVDLRRETHRTIFQFDTPLLDAANSVAAEEAFERFRKSVPPGVRIAVDFGCVEFVTDLWPVLPMGKTASRVEGHAAVCMRVNPQFLEVLGFLGLSNVPGYFSLDEGICPACAGAFDHARSTCAQCGRFEVERFTWRPRRPGDAAR